MPLTADDMLSEKDIQQLVESAGFAENEPPCSEVVDCLSAGVLKQATRARLSMARHESLLEDIDYARESLCKITEGLARGEVGAEQHILAPSLLFFPIPAWDTDAKLLTCRVYSLDADADPAGYTTLLKDINEMHWFATENPGQFAKTLMPFKNRANLLKALTVFFEEMTAVKSGAVDGLTVNFNLAAADLAKTLFVSPRRPKTEIYETKGAAPIIIDDIKLLELQAKLRWYFEQKRKEIFGELPAGTSIDKLKLASAKPSGMYAADSAPPPPLPKRSSRRLSSRGVFPIGKWLSARKRKG